jgi:hypothetical protein
MFEYMKKINWEKIVNGAVFIIAAAVGIILFTFAFVFGKAIIEAIF